MVRVSDIYNQLNTLAPFSECLEEDSVGLLVGSMDASADKVAVALDVTKDTVEAAINSGCTLLVTHHPAYFGELADQPDDSPAKVAMRSGLNIISAHTNLDIAKGGVNDVLCDVLGIKNTKVLCGFGDVPMARVGELCFDNVDELVKYAKEKLLVGGAKYTYVDSKITTVAVCGGSGGDFIVPAVEVGAQALITGESKHHLRLLAHEKGIALIELGHFCTEQPVKRVLAEVAKKAGATVVVLEEKDPAFYM